MEALVVRFRYGVLAANVDVGAVVQHALKYVHVDVACCVCVCVCVYVLPPPAASRTSDLDVPVCVCDLAVRRDVQVGDTRALRSA